ncbi:MAG: addiction module protein [Kiritimatiellae bacterium]|nr:addiction module protein [Kiritimatiellia bacterium]
MEAIWADLSKDSAAIESPSWHKRALAATETRVANGEESPLDWEIAKRQLRQTPA